MKPELMVAPPTGPGAEQLADLIMDSMGCADCDGTTVCAVHVQAFAGAYGAHPVQTAGPSSLVDDSLGVVLGAPPPEVQCLDGCNRAADPEPF